MITDAFDGFSFFGRFGFAGSVGLAAPHALHRFADALLSSVHESHVHRGPASAGGSRRRGAAAGGGAAGTGESAMRSGDGERARGARSYIPCSDAGSSGWKRSSERSTISSSSSCSSGYSCRTRLSKLSSRRSARRVATTARHVGHSFFPRRIEVSMQSAQKR